HHTGFVRRVVPAAFIRIDPEQANVEPGGLLSLTARFEGRLLPGHYEARLEALSNDPLQPVASVPVSVDQSGAPHMEVLGESLALRSFRSFGAAGASTQHDFLLSWPPGGDGALEIQADGDFSESSETATVLLDGDVLGTLGASGVDCSPAGNVFPV